jgi:origin recognition complex subunit 3
VAYIFKSEDGTSTARPSKRRKVDKKRAATKDTATAPERCDFVPLFGGSENPAAVRRRAEHFEQSWAPIETRIQEILKEANQATLEEVSAFVRGSQEVM